MVSDHPFQDCLNGITAAVPSTQEEKAWMAAGRKTAHIGEVEIEGDEETAFRNRSLPHHGILGAAQSLVGGAVRGVASRFQEIGVRPRQVLIQLHSEGRHRKGTSSSSLANTAA
jgi:hypothetical protein